MTCFGVGGGCHCIHDGVDDANGDGLILIVRWFLDAVGFNLMVEAPVQSSV